MPGFFFSIFFLILGMSVVLLEYVEFKKERFEYEFHFPSAVPAGGVHLTSLLSCSFHHNKIRGMCASASGRTDFHGLLSQQMHTAERQHYLAYTADIKVNPTEISRPNLRGCLKPIYTKYTHMSKLSLAMFYFKIQDITVEHVNISEC